ncbi:MAG TPA: glycerophosphodiester phosphodiesterase family protein [Pelobium sp.]
MSLNLNLSASRAIIFAISIVLLLGNCSKGNQKPDTTPSLVSSFSTAPEKPLAGDLVHFDPDDEVVGGDIVYSWDFGDNTVSSLKNPSHIYEKPGTFAVKLTIKKGLSEKTAAKELTVSLSNDIPSRMSLKEKLSSLNGKIMVCAHRANHENAPENSLKSVTDAIAEGIDMIEIDVRETKDGELVLMHDATLDRTTNGSGKVSDYLLKDLRKFNLYKSNGTLTDLTIPTLQEVLLASRGKIYIDLDIDSKAPFNKVYPVANQYGMLKQVFFYSSDIKVIKEIVNINNPAILPLPIIRNQDDFNQLSGLNINVIQFNVNNDQVKEQIKSKGWYIFRNAYVNTSNTPTKDNYSELNNVINVGGSIVQTDHPNEMKAKLHSQNLND